MQTVVENPSFKSSAKAAGMSETEVTGVTLLLSANPYAGELVKETGGIRKVRVARTGGGKSGGYRVFYIEAGQKLPVFLLWVLSKSDKGNLDKGQRNALAQAAHQTLKDYLR